MSQSPNCWCGNTDLIVFSPTYLRCPACETLVVSQMPEPETLQVTDDERDFYGREYWFSHQEKDLGFPNIKIRARTDLAERCLHWLRTILKYKLPPAQVLELGSAHGGFVALLRWAGFDTTGLELSPWVVQFARKTFGVPMLLGPVEDQQIKPVSLDIITLMDVLEHLLDPVGTMRYCLELLKPSGILVIQTPCLPEGRSYEDMVAQSDPFLGLLQEKEHLYLFSQRSIREFFGRLGVDHFAFEPAIFAHYDMFLVVSRAPLAVYRPAKVEWALSAAPGGRVVQALLDLDDLYRDLKRTYAEAQADQAVRLASIERLEGQVRELGEAARARLVQVEELGALLAESEQDRAARLGQVEELQQLLTDSEHDRAARLENVQRLERQVVEVEEAAQARLVQIEQLQQSLTDSEQDRGARLAQVEELQEQLADLQDETERLRSYLAGARSALQALCTGRIYRFMRRLGRWTWLEQTLSHIPSSANTNGSYPEEHKPGVTAPRLDARRSHIAVDLTPVLPGGENGGAKLMTTELIRHLSQNAPDYEFTLLTSERNHHELAALESSNVRCLYVPQQSDSSGPQASRRTRLKMRVQRWLATVLPRSAMNRLKSAYQAVSDRTKRSTLLREIGADLLFCPFTAPFFFDPSIPVVSVVYDLQYLTYPQFFSAEERSARDIHFKAASRLASRLICISDYVRRTILENADVRPEQAVTVHIRLFQRLVKQPAQEMAAVLDRYGLRTDRFLFYPANFWPHKNHQMLFTALGMYRARHPESDLKLVCTGTPGEHLEHMRTASERMGLSERVVFPGYVSDDEFATLLQSCHAVIFPSLYEGFGMPVLEAMAFGKPVLCSNATSLPEVAGEAALFFDPRKPREIVNAIERIESDVGLVAYLVQQGQQRLAAFGGPVEMAQQYLQVFHEVLSGSGHFTQALHGVYSDGWTQDRVVITYDTCQEQRALEITLAAPPWFPLDRVSATILPSGHGSAETHVIERGQEVTIRRLLPHEGGFVELAVDPVFQPQMYSIGEDNRLLGCLCQACRLVSPSGAVDLLAGEG